MSQASNDVVAILEQCAERSYAATISFGEVVATLAANGVESYYADYRGKTTTYYLATGATHTSALHAPALPVADAFDAPSVRAAIRGVQGGEIKYPEFLRITTEAGCIGYFVWIAGRHVKYFGRRGEVHVEQFPGS